MERIENGLKLKITGRLDGIFEYYLDFLFRNTEFSLNYDDMMGTEIHLKYPRIANETEKVLMNELCKALAGSNSAGPPKE